MHHAVAQRWQREIVRLFDPYRPECHYMRGPGPKCREKYGLSGARSDREALQPLHRCRQAILDENPTSFGQHDKVFPHPIDHPAGSTVQKELS